MRLYNTLGKRIEEFKPLSGNVVRMYSCGPTVYDHAHIGNLSSFIVADSLKRTLRAAGYKVEHVMNFTDVDDKTIRRSLEKYPDLEPKEALLKLTRHYEDVFKQDMMDIGNSIDDISFVRATDTIEQMQKLITWLNKDGFAYIADDGVYFSIKAYKDSGKKYGQLTHIDTNSTSRSRISNDEYDKDSAHDFALWKLQKDGEPSWPFKLSEKELVGRPGWHIECSAMSVASLGQPFDIHTGGVDLVFPHHENEIAQSTAGHDDPTYANFFVHSEHLLVDGKKMSKSLNNFFTLEDVKKKGFSSLAFRLLVLQSHYRNQSNFTWDNMAAAQNRLNEIGAWSDLRFQLDTSDSADLKAQWLKTVESIKDRMFDDTDTPRALASLASLINDSLAYNVVPSDIVKIIHTIDDLLGLNLMSRVDISAAQKKLLALRTQARVNKDWDESDKLRDTLKADGLEVRDMPSGQIWNRL